MCDDINILDQDEEEDDLLDQNCWIRPDATSQQITINSNLPSQHQHQHQHLSVAPREAVNEVEVPLEELVASSSNAIWQDSNDHRANRRDVDDEDADVDHNEYVVPEDSNDHISEMSQTFVIEHTKNHITERTNEDSSLS